MDLTHLLARFDGRVNRARFWTGLAFLLVFGFAFGGTANVLDWMLELRIPDAGRLGFLTLLAILLILYAFFALQAKRWHDRNKSGWWNLLMLVPVIGWLWTVIEAGMLAGTRGTNQYGPDTLG